MPDPCTEFELALLTPRVARRFAMMKKPKEDRGGEQSRSKAAKSSKQYVAEVEKALTSKSKFGWSDPAEVKEFMQKFEKLSQEDRHEFAYRLIHEEELPEELAQEFFKK